MKDPEEAHDTEPTGGPFAGAEDTDPGTEEVTSDTFPGELDAYPSEHDTDAFLRWLPTMWLGHRRRKELLQRPSSDGADFVAYACEGRPAVPSPRVRPEATVHLNVGPRAGLGALVDGEFGRDWEAEARDAPTVLKRRRIVGPRRTVALWAAVGFVALSVAIGGWAYWPRTKETLGGRGVAVAPPVPIARRLAKPSEPSESVSLPATTGFPRGARAMDTNPPAMPISPRAAASTPSTKEPRSRAERAGAGAARADSWAKGHAMPAAAASALPAKEQYFEAP